MRSHISLSVNTECMGSDEYVLEPSGLEMLLFLLFREDRGFPVFHFVVIVFMVLREGEE